MLQETSRTLSLAAAATTVIAFLALSDVAYGLAAGGTVTAIKLRGRKWNYSPITDAEYSNGDFIHIRGGCADDTAFLQPQANFSVEFWFKFAPEEYFSGSNVPHSFAMAQEYNFWMQYLIPIGGGESAWFGNWLSPCGWLTVIKSSPYAWDISPLVKQPAHTWMHIAVVNDNNNITAYINGTAVSNMYCAAKFDSAPVWTIGIRDWATDVAQKNQLSPIFPMTGEFSEFRVWTRPISLTEITSRMHRSLLANELADKNLMIYFDFNNITDGYIIQDMSPTKRLAGYMGGALGLEINTPELVPSTAPIVNISTTLVTMTMKESGDNPSSAKVPLVAIDVRTPAFSLLTASTPVTYTLTSLPDPSVLILTAGSGSASRILSGSLPISLGSSFDVTVTHRVNNAVSSWPAQRFNVSITFGGTTVVVPVVVNILKNAAPTVGDSGGAIAPPDEPPSSTQKPIYIPNFTWRNATYNTPLTFEFWTVGAESDRYIDLPDMSYAGKGRMNTEVNKNLVMDYGWDYDGSGRTVIPWRRKFGIWNHVAMISTGLRGRQWMYVNGNLVAQTTGNVAMRNNDRGLPPSNMTGFID
ncbi:hypothetical protein BC829DRAFT_283125 [Chytridium lagenaria]|nr:hypothetical protein BC829DRAFT_283125 [Chytridium lagenaria]